MTVPTPTGTIVSRHITTHARKSFLNYAMSVIKSRALPDVRDGLKPVHRRILYAMYKENNVAEKAYRKSAKSVGIVIGNYHPHGDSAVYDSMVRMSQKWVMNDILVDMHGNNGSVDGDAPAAMRYTEARLSKVAMEMLKDINKDTVDFTKTYDESDIEPAVLPSHYPQILVNGTSGIAVGMATEIPPHNLGEVCRALIALVDNPDMTLDEIMTYIKGPDFPTRGILLGEENIRHAYETGNTGEGRSLRLRSRVDIVEEDGKTFLHVTELPYQVNKDKLLTSLNQLQDDYNAVATQRKNSPNKVFEDKGYDFTYKESGVVDTTGKEDTAQNRVSIFIELKKDKDPIQVLNALYKKTSLEKTIPINFLALVPSAQGNGTVPRVLPLKSILTHYLNHQFDVLQRAYQYDLKKNHAQLKRLLAFVKATDKLDETIRTIRESLSNQDALNKLMPLLDIDEEQAQSILERRFQTLISMNQQKLREEYEEKLEKEKELQKVLDSEELQKQLIKDGFETMINKYGKERMSELGGEVKDIDDESLIPNDEVVVTVTHDMFIKRTKDSEYRTQRRKGIGVNSINMDDDDFVEHLSFTRNHDNILFFTNHGRVYTTKVHRIRTSTTRGYSIRSMFKFKEDETVQAILTIRDFSEKQSLFFTTKNGIVKKSKLSAYKNIHSNGIKAIKLDEDKETGEITDQLVGVSLTGGDSLVTLLTKLGKTITFKEDDVSTIGRTGRGVKGISLREGDSVVSVAVHKGDSELLIVTDKGYGKRTNVSEFRVQSKGGKGVAGISLTEKNGTCVVGFVVVTEEDTIILITKNEGKLMKVAVKEISQFKRNTQGSLIIRLHEGDSLQEIARVSDTEDEENDTEEELLVTNEE